MKPLKNPKKTIKVLYLYMALPLLLVAGALWVTTSFRSSREAAERPAATKAMDYFCQDNDDCGVGETCINSICVNPLRRVTVDEPERDKGISSAGWAAIIASIMGGLTGLIGAISQTILAFLAMRERRRSRD